MSEQEQNLDSKQRDVNRSSVSEKERNVIIIGIIILFVLFIILTGFIIEALINQHPVFESLNHTIFKQDSIILGSIALTVPILVYMILGIAIGQSIVTNFGLNKTIYFLGLVGIILILISFVILYKSYDWKLGFANYISYILWITGGYAQMIIEVSKKKYNFYYSKLVENISLFLVFLGVFIFALYYNQ